MHLVDVIAQDHILLMLGISLYGFFMIVFYKIINILQAPFFFGPKVRVSGLLTDLSI